MAVTAQYFVIANSLSGRSTTILEATLSDEDLIRGDDDAETITGPSGLTIFNGYTRFVQTGTGLDDIVREFEDGEATTTVTFSDGTSLSGVLALSDVLTFNFGSSSNIFLLDQNALAEAGKTLDDVVDIQVDEFIDHDLSYADLGFGEGTVTPPEPDPEPTPDPDLTVIEGTEDGDRLVGTDADEIFVGGDGNDKLIGGDGADIFVFGTDVVDADRDRDVIRDFDITEDTIVLEVGASVDRIIERNGNTIIRLDGDADRIVLRDTVGFQESDIIFTDDLFLA